MKGEGPSAAEVIRLRLQQHRCLDDGGRRSRPEQRSERPYKEHTALYALERSLARQREDDVLARIPDEPTNVIRRHRGAPFALPVSQEADLAA
jgi:hypothetical protein